MAQEALAILSELQRFIPGLLASGNIRRPLGIAVPQEFGGSPSSSDNTEAINAAFQRSNQVFLSDGSWNVEGPIAVPRSGSLVSAGSYGVEIVHTGSGRLFDLRGDGTNIVYSRRNLSGLRILGNANAGAVGVEIGDTYRTSLRDVIVGGYTNGTNIRLTNELQFTEGTVFDNVHSRNAAVCVEFNQAGAQPSFAETTFYRLGVVAAADGQIAVNLVGDCNIYGGFLAIKGNLEHANTTFLKLNDANCRIEDVTFAVFCEGPAGVGIDLADATWIRGTGAFKLADTLTRNCVPGSGFNVTGCVDVQTPAALAAEQTSLVFGTAQTLRVSGAGGGSNLHGIAMTRGAHGARKRILNVSANAITLVNESATEATATYRISVPNAVVLAAGDSCVFEYDLVAGRWRIVSVYN